ncbi:MAG: hypothetical protein P1U66_09155 [Thalassobius sp.]|nr:hypothetical protein [Thalassovita sp.]
MNSTAFGLGDDMAGNTIEQKALGLLNAFERAGKVVTRVTVEGRKIEIVLSKPDVEDEFERIDMRHGKT